MERGCADYPVKGTRERQVQEIAGHQTNGRSELRRKMFACGMQHVLRCIDANNAASRQSFDQFGRETPGSAPGIEHDLVAAQAQA